MTSHVECTEHDHTIDAPGADEHTVTCRYTDPGPVPPETPFHKRLIVIAALHAAAEHLANHPEIPTPQTITMNARPDYNGSDQERMRQLDQLAEANAHSRRYALDASHTPGRRHEYAEVRLLPNFDLKLTYVLSTTVAGFVDA